MGSCQEASLEHLTELQDHYSRLPIPDKFVAQPYGNADPLTGKTEPLKPQTTNKGM
jgi:hypothetical protein